MVVCGGLWSFACGLWSFPGGLWSLVVVCRLWSLPLLVTTSPLQEKTETYQLKINYLLLIGNYIYS